MFQSDIKTKINTFSKMNWHSFTLFHTFLFNSIVVPVDAATAPIKTEGIPSMKMRGAAIKQMILAVSDEEADSVLWWKS